MFCLQRLEGPTPATCVRAIALTECLHKTLCSYSDFSRSVLREVFVEKFFGQIMWKSQLRKFHAARMLSCFLCWWRVVGSECLESFHSRPRGGCWGASIPQSF